MPIPKPHKGEHKDNFIDRCMSSPPMQEYPRAQRFAICNKQWNDAHAVEEDEPPPAPSPGKVEVSGV